MLAQSGVPWLEETSARPALCAQLSHQGRLQMQFEDLLQSHLNANWSTPQYRCRRNFKNFGACGGHLKGPCPPPGPPLSPRYFVV